MGNLTKGTYMIETVVGAVGIVVTMISIIVTVISIVQTSQKRKH